MNNDQDDNKHDNKDMIKENKDNEAVSKSDADGLLKEWGLGQYIDIFVYEEGWDDPEGWIDEEITFEYLKGIGFKPGHARKFMREAKKLYQ